MNKDAAIKQFVKENRDLLTSNAFDKKIFRSTYKRFFFEKHKDKFGKPSNKEIMAALIEHLKTRAVHPAEIKTLIDNLPFFKEISEETRQDLHKKIEENQYTTALSDEALQTIKSVDAYKALELVKGKEIEENKKKELGYLEQQIETKRQEYESLPSILDAKKIEEPEINPEVEDIKPWWQRFYLKADPFPNQEGLTSIPKELYEQVIFKTKPFQNTLSGLQQNPNYLFHTGFLLVGGYGYGKTTFIDYLSHYLINRDIIPIHIIVTRAFPDSSGFADNFYQLLKTELQREVIKMTSFDRKDLFELEIEDQIIELASRIISARKNGIIVFLDDYHKLEKYSPQIFEFLGTLQMLKAKFTRSKVNAGFIVSGLPSWKDELRRNTQLSGFLDNTPIEIPEANPELICGIFNHRIKAFYYDESTPRFIKTDFVQTLVREQGQGVKIGVRDYLRTIVSELSKNNQAIVDSPVEISDETLSDIKQMIEADPYLKSSFNKLILELRFKRFSKEQIAKCLELLVHIGMQNGISEDDKQFIDNKYYFIVLRDVGLTQRQKTTKGSSVEWGLRINLRKIVSAISEKHHLNLNDYLLKIYAYKDYGANFKTSQPEEVHELSELKRLINSRDLRIEKSIIDHFNTGMRLYDSLDNLEGRLKVEHSELERASNALEALSLALFELDNSQLYFNKLKIHDINTQWSLHPFKDESIQEAFNRINDAQTERTSQRFLHAVRQVKNVFPIIGAHIRAIVEDQCTDRDFAMLRNPLAFTEEEINLFQEIRSKSYSNIGKDHFDYVKKLTDHLEIKLRQFLFFTSYLLFGEEYFEQCPQIIRSYAHKNLDSHSTYATEKNKFDGLTRTQYRIIFTENNNLRTQIINHLGLTWTEADWRLFADMFSSSDITTGHQHIDTFSQAERSRYHGYCKMSADLVIAINKLIAEYLQSRVFICIISETTPSPEDCLYRSSLKFYTKDKENQNKKVFRPDWPEGLEPKDPVKSHDIKTDSFKRIADTIHAQLQVEPTGILTQDLLDIDYITTHYRVNLADFVHCLAYIKHVSRDLIIEQWFGSSVAITLKK